MRRLVISAFAVILFAGLLSAGLERHSHARQLLGPTGPSGAGGGIAHVQDQFASTAAGTNTQAVTLTGTGAGNFFIVGVGGINGTGTIGQSTSVVTNNGTSCTHATGTFTSTDVNLTFADLWYCPNNAAAGSVTFTATVTTNTGTLNGIQSAVAEFSGVSTTTPDLGLGNQAQTGTTAATTISATLTGPLTQNNQLIVSFCVPLSVGASSVGSGQIAFTSRPDATYQIVSTSGSTITHTFNFPSSDKIALSVAAFKHP